MEQNKPIKMTFFRAILKGLAGTVKFRGRASRAEFWYYTLFCFIMQLILFTGLIWKESLGNFTNAYHLGLIILGLMILLAISHCAASVRRFQDTERNGWMWFGTYLIPWIVTIVSAIWKSEYDISLRNREPIPGLPDQFVMNWWCAIVAISVIILIAAIVMTVIRYCRKGTEGPNNYGADPLYSNSPKSNS